MGDPAAVAQEVEKLDSLVQAPLRHLRPAPHFRDDGGDLGARR